MKQWKVMVTLAILAALVGFWTGAPADAQTLEFYQMDFKLDGSITNNSDWGTVALTFTGSDDILYFNLTVNGSWQVQNIPVLSLKGTGNPQTQRFNFDLGNDVGEDVTSLDYAYALTTDTLVSAPTGRTSAPVGDFQYTLFTGESDNPLPPVPAPAVPLIGGGAINQQHKNENFPNQKCGNNECVPAALSNSLTFLNDKHGLNMDPDDIDIETMKEASGWDPDGASDWCSKKRAYMRAHGYPIETTEFPPDRIGDLIAEIDDDQDIEVSLAGHAACVVGITDLGNGRYSVTIASDVEQEDAPGGAGEEGLETGTWNNNPPRGWEGGFGTYGLNYFCVECPIHRCPGLIHKDTEGTAIDLHVLYAGTGGTLRDVRVISAPDDCSPTGVEVVNGNQINFRWSTPCFDYCETIEYEFTVDYPCEQVFIASIEWTYGPPPIPTLTQWVLIILALSVGAFFIWQLKRRRKAVASV